MQTFMKKPFKILILTRELSQMSTKYLRSLDEFKLLVVSFHFIPFVCYVRIDQIMNIYKLMERVEHELEESIHNRVMLNKRILSTYGIAMTVHCRLLYDSAEILLFPLHFLCGRFALIELISSFFYHFNDLLTIKLYAGKGEREKKLQWQ